MSRPQEHEASESTELLEMALETLADAEEKLRLAEQAQAEARANRLAAERVAARAAAEQARVDELVCERERLEREVLDLSALEQRLRQQVERQRARAAEVQVEPAPVPEQAVVPVPAHAVHAASPLVIPEIKLEPEHQPEPAPEPAPEPQPEPDAPAPKIVLPSKRPSHAARNACIVLAALVAVALGALGGAYFKLFELPEPIQSRIELLPDVDARQGRLSADEQVVLPSSYRLFLNRAPVVERGSLAMPIRFENPQSSSYSLRLKLSLDETGEIVASTRRVLPGTYVESIELSRPLEPGEHAATALVELYSGNTVVNTMSTAVFVTAR